MAEAWSAAAPAELIQVPLAPHGFVHFGGPVAARTLTEIRGWLDRTVPG